MIFKNKKFAVISGLLLVGALPTLHAAPEYGTVSVHGYGHSGYVQSKENSYTGRESGESWDYNYLAVIFSAIIDERTKIVAQIRSGTEITPDSGAYVQHNLTDSFTLRAGQMKAPIGLYNEIRDIKLLQLSTLEPLMYRDSAGTLPDSLRGVSTTYHYDISKHRVSFDVYGGEPVGSNQFATNGVNQKNIYGGRIIYKTPIGLKVAASYFENQSNFSPAIAQGAPVTAPGAIILEDIKTLSIFSVSYLSNRIDFKTEYAEATAFGISGRAYYTQLGVTFAEKFTPFIRYDGLVYAEAFQNDPRFYQYSSVLGINYKLNHSVGLRMENHWNRGYAIVPATSFGQLNPAAGTPLEESRIFAMSVNFIF
jgi:hypothetical protein